MTWTGRSAALYHLTNWVARLVTLHLFFLVLTLCGGIVLGVFPAWYATLIAIRSELRGEPMAFADMWRLFRRLFRSANVFGLGSGALVLAGLLEILLLAGAGSPLLQTMAVVTTFWIACLTLGAWAFLSEIGTIHPATVRRALLATLAHPVRVLAVAGAVAAVLAGFCLLPALAIATGSTQLALAICLPTGAAAGQLNS